MNIDRNFGNMELDCENTLNLNCVYEFYGFTKWLRNHSIYPIGSVIVYLILIYYGQKFMANRKPFDLKCTLFVWNSSIATFSILGTVVYSKHLFELMSKVGLQGSMCIPLTEPAPDTAMYLWGSLFLASKFVELGDTILLILRKRKVLFLHWYHHVTVLLFVWFAIASEISSGRHFIFVNYFVHSLMYSYLALKTIDITLPKFVPMTITMFEILQMIVGIYITLYTRFQLQTGKPCEQTDFVVNSGLLLYGSYLLLFVHFFLNSYVLSKKKSKKD